MLVKTKMLGLVLVTAMVLTSPILVYADNGPVAGDNAGWHQDGGWQHHGDHMMMAKILGLSDDQVKQLKDLHKQQKEATKALFEQIKTNREALSMEIVKATPDMNKITDLETQLKTLTAQMIDNHLNSLLAVKKIMTPEQFAGYMALKKEKAFEMMHKMHGRFSHHDGFDKDNHHWNGGDQDGD